ncbi:MAG: phosphatidate cytidylyltransferase [Clostridia bacterium]|nr:phosphatidate cytidylyltransferase [Clostridia bacterium]
MLKRTVTGLLIAAVWVVFFLLKAFVKVDIYGTTLGTFLFDFMLLCMAALGANEMLRIFENKIAKPHRVITVLYPILLLPMMSLFGIEWAVIITMTAILAVLAVAVPCHETVTVEGIALTFLSMVYPSGLLVCMVAINHLAPFTALVLAFAVTPLADVMAYFVGSTFKGPKLCPNVSPNKTVSGAIGGLFGGIVAAILVCVVFYNSTGYTTHYFDKMWIEVLVYALIGFIGAIFTILGDLVESLMKRKLGIKDMGRLLPGHGGVMDRIDGILFEAPLIAFIFCAVLPPFIA